MNFTALHVGAGLCDCPTQVLAVLLDSGIDVDALTEVRARAQASPAAR